MTFSDVKQSLDEKEANISRSNSSRTSTTEYYSAISSGKKKNNFNFEMNLSNKMELILKSKYRQYLHTIENIIILFFHLLHSRPFKLKEFFFALCM